MHANKKKMFYACVCVCLSVCRITGNTSSLTGSWESSHGRHHHQHHHHHHHPSGQTL